MSELLKIKLDAAAAITADAASNPNDWADTIDRKIDAAMQYLREAKQIVQQRIHSGGER